MPSRTAGFGVPANEVDAAQLSAVGVWVSTMLYPWGQVEKCGAEDGVWVWVGAQDMMKMAH